MAKLQQICGFTVIYLIISLNIVFSVKSWLCPSLKLWASLLVVPVCIGVLSELVVYVFFRSRRCLCEWSLVMFLSTVRCSATVSRAVTWPWNHSLETRLQLVKLTVNIVHVRRCVDSLSRVVMSNKRCRVLHSRRGCCNDMQDSNVWVHCRMLPHCEYELCLNTFFYPVLVFKVLRLSLKPG